MTHCLNTSFSWTIRDFPKRFRLSAFFSYTNPRFRTCAFCRAIRTSQFSMDGLRVLTGSDDKTVKLWDLPTGREMAELGGHEDYVRAQSRVKVSPHLWATGCYDHKLRLFDLRTQKAIFTLNHDYPVEAVLIPPGGGLAISAGGQEVRVFELFAGGRILQRLSNHAKAVTCLALDATETRLLTGGLDEQVKVHDLNTFEVGASIHFKGQLLSVGASPDKSRLAAGLASGKCTVKLIDKKSVAMGLDWAGESLADRRKSEETRLFREISRGQQKEHKRQPRPGSLRYFLRGKNEGPTAGDVVIGEKTRLKRKSYDMYLRKFMYGAALDEALTKKRIDVTAAVIEDLIQREGLRIALSNRSPERLIPVLQCLERNVSDPRYAELMLVVSNMVLDLYSKVVGRWVEVDTALARVHRAVQRETQAKNDLMCLVGMMELAIGTPAADPIQVLDNA
uniref:U3 small nucleolar RNA-associated protein 15 C-terminal domain-containing protein n=1 Tax=Rhodosorus marinus TaxID=101924 RepID=A0A7S2ZRE7_9RHOD|mmetsp:Transcript_29799/g.114406  ORF Transcript_29799/g.114406 Transcript_29799/m.114406 type:complete len:450 (+) Transcript_29799:609-1958(+)